MTFLKDAEEYFCRIVCGPIERELLTANDSRVPETSEIQVELIAEVLADHLIKNFWYTVNCFWLKNNICRRVYLWEVVTAEHSNAAWDENTTIVIFRNPQRIHDAVDVYIDGQIRVLFSEGGEDTSQMNYVVYLICFDDFAISSGVCNI